MEKFIDESQRANVLLDYIIRQGLKGHHLLFDNDQIRRAFEKRGAELSDLGSKRISEVRDALRDIFSLPNMDEQREYITGLPEELQSVLVFLYFQILEKNILSKKPRLH